jgi:hypothetical protein
MGDRESDSSFATLIDIARTYCHPEAYEDAYDDLKVFAGRANDARVSLFKQELRRALIHPERVPQAELSKAAQYDDGSAEKFLRRLWRDLYPDEPVPKQA